MSSGQWFKYLGFIAALTIAGCSTAKDAPEPGPLSGEVVPTAPEWNWGTKDVYTTDNHCLVMLKGISERGCFTVTANSGADFTVTQGPDKKTVPVESTLFLNKASEPFTSSDVCTPLVGKALPQTAPPVGFGDAATAQVPKMAAPS